jgi:hypothetical protein
MSAPLPLSKVMVSFMRIAAEEFHPKLLSNVLSVEIEHASGEENQQKIDVPEMDVVDGGYDNLN